VSDFIREDFVVFVLTFSTNLCNVKSSLRS